MESFVHPTAIVDEPAHIGAGTHIWHFSHIMKNTVIGEQCNLGQNVFVASGVKVGNHCKIQNNVSLYEGVELEDHVFCGPSMVFTNVKHPRCEIVRRGEYAPTYVEHGATLGANCTIVCGTRIGRYAFIAAGAVVAGDVPPFALMAGVPARRIGWSGRLGYRLEPVGGQPGHFVCPGNGELYIQKDEQTLMPMDEVSNKAAEANQDQPAPPVPLLDL
ncbi:MAG TPA: acyltransferase, partial [Armatimonadota bacterium]